MRGREHLLGNNGDLDKADEEENKRGARHVGTESVIHLLGVLTEEKHGEWPHPLSATVQTTPVTQCPWWRTHGGQSWTQTEGSHCKCPYGPAGVRLTWDC